MSDKGNHVSLRKSNDVKMSPFQNLRFPDVACSTKCLQFKIHVPWCSMLYWISAVWYSVRPCWNLSSFRRIGRAELLIWTWALGNRCEINPKAVGNKPNRYMSCNISWVSASVVSNRSCLVVPKSCVPNPKAMSKCSLFLSKLYFRLIVNALCQYLVVAFWKWIEFWQVDRN